MKNNLREHNIEWPSLLDSKLSRAMEKLVEQYVVLACHATGKHLSEIIQPLNLPYETVKKHHTRRIKRLRKLLRHLGILPGYSVTNAPEVQCYLLDNRMGRDHAAKWIPYLQQHDCFFRRTDVADILFV